MYSALERHSVEQKDAEPSPFCISASITNAAARLERRKNSAVL